MANLDIKKLYAKYENLKNYCSADTIIEQFVQQMNSNELQSHLEYLCKNFDINFNRL